MLWSTYLLPLIEGACVVITMAFIMFRVPVLRQALASPHHFLGRLLLVVLFIGFAIYGTHKGQVITPDSSLLPVQGMEIGEGDAILNFRDLPVTASGLLLGPAIGLSVGLIAGYERYELGGFTAVACGFATVFGGLLAGLVHRYRHGLFKRMFDRNLIKPVYAALVVMCVVFIQKVLILLLSEPLDLAEQLVQQTFFPMLLVNAAGCFLLIHMIRALDSERRARDSELREKLVYFRAQVDAHFFCNLLVAFQSLIRTAPDRAREYVTKLGRFMQEIQGYATKELITFEEELEQLQRYVDFQQLRFEDKIDVSINIKEGFPLAGKLPPKTLLTLVENSFNHGRIMDRKLTVQIRLCCHRQQNILEVVDNGKGIPVNRLKKLGKQIVDSEHAGGGHDLFYLTQALKLTYGKKASLEILNNSDQGAIVRLRIPSCVGMIKSEEP